MHAAQRVLIEADDCEEAARYLKALFDDPMTSAMGAPTDDIVRGYLTRHIKTCDKCRTATDEANMP